jgi:hypothetical protein
LLVLGTPLIILSGAANALMCPFLGPVVIDRIKADCQCTVELDRSNYSLRIYPTTEYTRSQIMNIVDRVGYDSTTFTVLWTEVE